MRGHLFRTGYIGLGSNMGDQASLLRRALDALDSADRTAVERVSPVFRTEPQGVRKQDWFSNCVARVRTALEPEELLLVLSGIEMCLGRRREERWGPRTMDLDILLLGDIFWDSQTLQIPHPRMHERAFVLVPLMCLDPGLQILGRTPAQWLSDLTYSISGDTIRQEQSNF